MKITWILYFTAAVHEYYCRVSHPANNIHGVVLAIIVTDEIDSKVKTSVLIDFDFAS